MLLVISRIQSHQIAGKGPYRQSRRATSSRTLRLDYRVKMDESQWLLAGEVRQLFLDSAFAVRCDLPNAFEYYARAVCFYLAVDILRRTYVHSRSLLGGRLTVRLRTLDPPIGVRIPASQPTVSRQTGRAASVVIVAVIRHYDAKQSDNDQ